MPRSRGESPAAASESTNSFLSFMSQWGAPRSPTSEQASSRDGLPSPIKPSTPSPQPPSNTIKKLVPINTATPPASASTLDIYAKPSPGSPTMPSRARGDSRLPRPSSIVQSFQPPIMEVANDTPPELQPIFTYLNSHSNKLYQEGYFLKLHDLDSRGRPSTDRTWSECFAQLVGTVLSLWDAAALDVAGEDGEVVPTFINLSDASIKMIESLPMNGVSGGNLQNVLSISTAANNRYLLHFNSLNSLTQWTAGIRLAIFEHATLQESYTGSLVAGKGKLLNNIRTVMERSRFKTEDWVRVRFGAGTPWRRCWCVISPPDEKEYQKAQKHLSKKKTYDRSTSVPKGDIKFYDTRKVTKKTIPIATITDAYAAYSIYPQSKPLIDQSTLLKLEGLVTIHTNLETTTEGFVFVMPEVHPGVMGFEMMLRWLFPVFDTFALYGRPNRLIADTLDQRGLMFAMPSNRRYGYLDILDVSGLIHTEGSQAWSERQWRKELKKLTSTRMMSAIDDSPHHSLAMTQRRNTASRTSLPPTGRGAVRFEDGADLHSSPASKTASPVQLDRGQGIALPRRLDSLPPEQLNMSPHKRSVSDAVDYKRYQAETPPRLSYEASRPFDGEQPPQPPPHRAALGRTHGPGSLERITSENDVPTNQSTYYDLHSHATTDAPPAPVASPPAFLHSPNSRPATQPKQMPELRRANSAVDQATLFQMQEAARADRPEEDYGNAAQSAERNAVFANTLANRSLGVPADRSQGLVNIQRSRSAERDPRQRLSTIPGSPYVGGDLEQFQPMVGPDTQGNEVPPQVPQHGGVTPHTDGMADITPEREGSVRSAKIMRKPLPPHPHPETPSYPDPRSGAQMQDPDSPPSPSSHGSLRGALIDQDALERILNDGDRSSTMHSIITYASTPDYASTATVSTRADKEPVDKPRADKPRAGKLKTVGDPELGQRNPEQPAGKHDTYYGELQKQAQEMPDIDFGPTLTYKPTERPGTSGTITPGGMLARSRSRSGDRLGESSRDGPGASRSPILMRTSTGDGTRKSYIGGRTNSSSAPMTPTDEVGNRRSIVWQPGMAASNQPGNRTSLTPEQWVQHRASMAAQPQKAPPRPVYAHDRKDSSGSNHALRRSATNTPPLGRMASGEWGQQYDRNSPNSRPPSRGAGGMLNPPSPGGGGILKAQPTSLSAKEQMHVARATGTPLITVAPKDAQKQQAVQEPGLIGAMAAREREKAAFKEGVRGGMVQQAIAARQLQQQQMDLEVQQQAQLQAQQHAQQQWQAQQFQQQAYQKVTLAQIQAPINYPQSQYGGSQMGMGQQRPPLQRSQTGSTNRSSYFSTPSYAAPSPSVYSPGTPGISGGGYSSAFAQRLAEGQQQLMMQQAQGRVPSPGPQQAYGASYFNQQQGRYGGQRR